MTTKNQDNSYKNILQLIKDEISDAILKDDDYINALIRIRCMINEILNEQN